MTTVKTEVINHSDVNLILKEGINMVYRELCILEKKVGKYTIKCHTDATYREYWMGTSLDSGPTSVQISSDDCLDYQTIFIENDLEKPKHTVKAVKHTKRGAASTDLVNRTAGELELVKNGAETVTTKLPVGEKIRITSDCEYSVTQAGAVSKLELSTKAVATAQRINVIVSETDNTTGTNTLGTGTVSRASGLYLTDLANKTSIDIRVKRGSDPNADGVEVATLKKDEKKPITYDPKMKKDQKFWVELYMPSSSQPAAAAGTSTTRMEITRTQFVDFERIEVMEDASPGKSLILQPLDPRPTGPSKKGIVSKFFGSIRGFLG